MIVTMVVLLFLTGELGFFPPSLSLSESWGKCGGGGGGWGGVVVVVGCFMA